MKRTALRDCVTGRARVDSHGSTPRRARLEERIVAGAELERDGVVAFRGVDAQRILKEEFDIDCSLSSTYRLLHRIKLSWLAPRPRHPQADATAQAAFSQLLDCN
jgi:transposase